MSEKVAVNKDASFYIQSDCCLSCGVPQKIAPELFGWSGEGCCINRQPNTKEELDKTVELLWAQEVGCIRYGGDDPIILQRLAELGITEHCDAPPPTGIKRAFRNHVTFKDVSGVEQIAPDLAERFRAHLQAAERKALEGFDTDTQEKYKYRFKQGKQGRDAVTFSYSWYETFHPVEVVRLPEAHDEWLIRHSPLELPGSQGVSFQLHDWLTTDGRFSSIRWYTALEWNGSKRWWELPW